MRTENNDLISHKERNYNHLQWSKKKTVVKLAMENSNRSAAQ